MQASFTISTVTVFLSAFFDLVKIHALGIEHSGEFFEGQNKIHIAL